MSHDIRTPMNAIIGMTTIARQNIENKVKTLDCLNKIGSSSAHLLELINSILSMSKIESGKVILTDDELSLPQLLEDVLNIIRPVAAKNGSVCSWSLKNWPMRRFWPTVRISSRFC